MEILIFIVVLVALIVVHEFGHLVVAKWAGMRVDEFGIGYPPRAAVLGRAKETEITLNWLPFGGFVKIYGEDADGSGEGSFTSKNRFKQALVLVAGIVMNLLFAYVLLSLALMLGTPRALSEAEIARATHLQLDVAAVMPGSPAARAGLMPADSIVSAQDALGSWTAGGSESFPDFVAASDGKAITLALLRNGAPLALTLSPQVGLVPSDPAREALGIEIASVGVVPLSLPQAFLQGAELTYGATVLTAAGLLHFFAGIFTLSADLSQVAGPVGIVGAVGGAARTGFGDLLSLTALISINLALINLIPVPALDGGRLLFVMIESVIRRPIKKQIAQSVNAVGFALLVLLMVVVTAHDIYKIVG